MACWVVLCLSGGLAFSQEIPYLRFHFPFLASDLIADGIHTKPEFGHPGWNPDPYSPPSDQSAEVELIWVHQLRAEIARARATRDANAIHNLSLILDRYPLVVRCIDDPAAWHINKAIVREAADVLRTIPGHGEHHHRKIIRAAADFDNAQKFAAKVHYRRIFCDERYRAFGALSHIGSSESVRILGEFVTGQDRLEVENFAPKGFGPTGESSGWAASALSRLPLRSNKPDHSGYENEEAWSLWYHEVKTGIRTFAFDGDPQDYNLDGPVASGKNPAFKLPPKPVEKVVPPKFTNIPTSSPLAVEHLALALSGIILISGWGIYRYRAIRRS